jgi:hypothetical protein
MLFQMEFTTHGLHINSRGKITLLIAKRLGDNDVSAISCIPVITSEISFLFILKATAQRRLRYFNFNYLQLKNQDRTVGSSTSLQNLIIILGD